MLETMTSSHGTSQNEVIKRETVESPLGTPWTFSHLVDSLSQGISPTRIIAGASGVLDVVGGFEPLEALHFGVVNVLGEGNESRRSVGSRHLNVEDGLMVQGAMANAVVGSSCQAWSFTVSSSPPSGFICSLTGQTPDLLHPLCSDVLGCIVLFLSSSDSSLFYFYTPLSSGSPLSPITPLDLP